MAAGCQYRERYIFRVLLELVFNPFIVVVWIIDKAFSDVKTEIQVFEYHVSDKDR